MSEENWKEDYRKKLFDLYLTYPSKIRERLAAGVLRKGAEPGVVKDILAQTDALEERLKTATPEQLYVAGPEGEIALGRLASALSQRAYELTGEWLYMEQLEPGALYLISARNASVGLWDPNQKGFVIARTKFSDVYLFVEYHWDNGPPYGTARPWKKLEAAREFKGKPEKLAYLVEKNSEYKDTDWRDR